MRLMAPLMILIAVAGIAACDGSALSTESRLAEFFVRNSLESSGSLAGGVKVGSKEFLFTSLAKGASTERRMTSEMNPDLSVWVDGAWQLALSADEIPDFAPGGSYEFRIEMVESAGQRKYYVMLRPQD
jgi:hypothetical protein